MDSYAPSLEPFNECFRIMETRKDRMAHPYVPKLHDYVIWNHKTAPCEGWVYFADEDHISIEIAVKDKPHCDITNHKHCKVHTLVVCQNWNWHQLEYVKSRRNFHDDRPQ